MATPVEASIESTNHYLILPLRSVVSLDAAVRGLGAPGGRERLAGRRWDFQTITDAPGLPMTGSSTPLNDGVLFTLEHGRTPSRYPLASLVEWRGDSQPPDNRCISAPPGASGPKPGSAPIARSTKLRGVGPLLPC